MWNQIFKQVRGMTNDSAIIPGVIPVKLDLGVMGTEMRMANSSSG